MATELEFKVGQGTDRGRRREHNEDSLSLFEPQDPDQLAARGSVYVVADGMGGHEAGAVASDLACRKIIDEYYYGDPALDVKGSLERAFKVANREIYEQASRKREWAGMGSTAVAVVLRGKDELYVANVGDSRAYLVRGEDMWQITKDHSWVQRQIDAGLTPEEAQEKARKEGKLGAITRVLGRRPYVQLDIFDQDVVQPDDIIVLCSDGLCDLARDEEIQKVVTRYEPQEAVDRLIRLANRRGGRDNITAMVIKVSEAAMVPEFVGEVGRDVPRRLTWALTGAIVLVTAVIAAAWIIRFRGPRPSWQPTPGVAILLPTREPTPTLRPGETPPPTSTPITTNTPTPLPPGLPTPTSRPAPSTIGLREPEKGPAGEVILTWDHDWSLSEDEWYIVTIRWTTNGKLNQRELATKDRRISVDLASLLAFDTRNRQRLAMAGTDMVLGFYPHLSPEPITFEWFVALKRLRGGRIEDGTAQWEPIGEPSPVKTFIWAPPPTPTIYGGGFISPDEFAGLKGEWERQGVHIPVPVFLVLSSVSMMALTLALFVALSNQFKPRFNPPMSGFALYRAWKEILQ